MGYSFEQKKLKEQAKNADLTRYLQDNGISLKSENGYYRHSNHKSLIIFVSKKRGIYNWIWNSTDKKGTAIDYLMNTDLEFGYSYNKAIEELNKYTGYTIIQEQKEFNINAVVLTKDIRKSIAYLNKTRKIDNKIIELLIEKKLIAQTKEKNNIAFLIKDENKNVIGIELNTTLSDRRFKGISKNSKYGYGFNLTNTNNPKSALYFESAIDLLSFMQFIGIDRAIKKLNTCILISLGGLKENIINHMQSTYNNPKIFLCIDNINIDKASRIFLGQIKAKYKDVNEYLPTGLYKDWNDVIQNKI